jgi:hypothetical protein
VSSAARDVLERAIDSQPMPDDGTSSGLSAFTADRPLLLLSDFSPETAGGGAVIIKSLLTPADRERIVWLTLSELKQPAGAAVVSLAQFGRRSLLKDGTLNTSALRRTACEVVRSRNATAAWVVAHGASLRMAPGLAGTGIPLHVTVHDDPAWGYALMTRRYLPLAPLLARDLGRTLRAASSVDVVSAGMAEAYRRRYGVESTLIHRGLPGPVAAAPRYDRSQGLSVAVLGSTYGFRELGGLANALALAQQQLKVPAKLTVIGGVDESQVRQVCPPSLAIEITGHLDESQGIDRLRESFLLYLSYPFRRRGKMLRTTSFPTKLSTYVQAARPLLLHMPSESSVAFLGASSPYATLWGSLDPSEGAEILAHLWRAEATDESFHVEADEVRERHFDLIGNRAEMYRLLNSLVSAGTRAA